MNSISSSPILMCKKMHSFSKEQPAVVKHYYSQENKHPGLFILHLFYSHPEVASVLGAHSWCGSGMSRMHAMLCTRAQSYSPHGRNLLLKN